MFMKFNEKLLQLRKEKGYSQEELAQKLGVSRQAISKWEVSDSYPEVENILEICKLFDVSTDYLLKDELEEINTISSQDKTRKKRVGFLIGVFLCVLGLLVSAVGWRQYQTIISISAGIILQLVGVLVYELCKKSKKDDFKFYSIFVVLILPYTTMIMSDFFLGFYPKPIAGPVYILIRILYYLALAGLGVYLVKLLTHKSK